MEDEPLRWSEKELDDFVKAYLPHIYEQAINPEFTIVIIKHDEVAPEGETQEFMGLGAAIKFCIRKGKEIRIV